MISLLIPKKKKKKKSQRYPFEIAWLLSVSLDNR